MKLNPLVLALGLIPLTGCGGGSSNTDTDIDTSTYSVKAIDGYLRNAQVWLDLDGDYQLDDNEPSALSGEGGVASLDVTGIDNPEQYKVVVQAVANQTIDEDTIDETNPDGTTITSGYLMSAPAGETDVTPLSTLVDVILEQNISTASTELTDEEVETLKTEAVSEVAELLGISSDDVLGDFIEEENDEITYAAENIVASSILPETSDEMSEVTGNDEDSSTSDDSDTGATFLATVEALTDTIKNAIETAETGAGDDEVDYSALESVVTEETNTTTDTDNDGVANYLDAFPMIQLSGLIPMVMK